MFAQAAQTLICQDMSVFHFPDGKRNLPAFVQRNETLLTLPDAQQSQNYKTAAHLMCERNVQTKKA